MNQQTTSEYSYATAVSNPSSKVKLDGTNWFQFEAEMFNYLNRYGEAGEEVRFQQANSLKAPVRRSKISYEMFDMGDKKTVTKERPWDPAVDEKIFQDDLRDHVQKKLRLKQHRANLWVLLVNSVEKEVLDKLETSTTDFSTWQKSSDVLNLWKRLKDLVMQESTNNAARVRQRWSNLRQAEPEKKSLVETVKLFDMYLKYLDGIGASVAATLTEQDRIQQLLTCVDQKRFEPIIQMHHCGINPMTSYAKLKDTLFKFDDTCSPYLVPKVEKDSTLAMSTFKYDVGKKGTTDKSIECHNCGRRGHKSFECSKPKRDCNKCGRNGHMGKYCRSKGKKEGGEVGSSSNQKSKTEGRSKRNVHFHEKRAEEQDNSKKQKTAYYLEREDNMDTSCKVEEWLTDDDDDMCRGCYTTLVSSTYANDGNEKDSLLVIDSGAEVHVFKHISLAKRIGRVVNLQTSKGHTIMGVSGRKLLAEHVGTIQDFGDFYVVPEAHANLFSIIEATKSGNFAVTFDDSGCNLTYGCRRSTDEDSTGNVIHIPRQNCSIYQITISQLRQIIRCKRALLSAIEREYNTRELPLEQQYTSVQKEDKKEYNDQGPKAAINLSTSNVFGPPTEEKFSKEQRERARQVIKLHQSMMHISYKRMSEAMENGLIIGCKLTPRDINNALQLHGACTHCMAGKVTKPSYKSSQNEPAHEVGDIVHCDIFCFSNVTIGGNKFYLLVLDEFSGYLVFLPMKSKSAPHLRVALHTLKALFRRYHHFIRTLHADHESSINAVDVDLAALEIVLAQTPPYQHEQRIERYVQTIKTHARAILDSLEYDLPEELYGELILAIVTWINEFPNSLHPTQTPCVIFKGVKLDVSQKLLIPFGTLAMVHHPGRPDASANKLGPRSELAVILGPAVTSKKAVRCFVFSTSKIVIRHHVTVLDALPVQFDWKVKSKDSECKFLKSTFQKVANVGLEAIIQESMVNLTIGSKVGVNEATQRINGSVDAQQFEEYEALFGEQSIQENIPCVNSDHSNNDITAETKANNATIGQDEAASTSMQDMAVNFNQDNFDSPHIGHEIEGVESENIPNPGVNNMQSRDDNARQQQHTPSNSSTTTSVGGDEDSRAAARFPRESKKRNWKQFEDDPWSNKKARITFNTSLAAEVREGRKYATQTKVAVMDEIRNMVNYRIGVYRHQEEIEDWLRVLNTFMLIKHKLKPDGSYDRTKGRFTVNGAEQGLNMYEDIASATVGLVSVFQLFSIASKYKAIVVSYDIAGAFLETSKKKGPNSPQDKPIYIRIRADIAHLWIVIDPEAKQFLNARGELYIELARFLYGLKQAPLEFQRLLKSVLEELGYRSSIYDECVYIKKCPSKKSFSILTIHVDDILQVTNDDGEVNHLKEGLEERFKKVTFNSEVKSYLGMSIQRSHNGKMFDLSQVGLIDRMVDDWCSIEGVSKSTFAASVAHSPREVRHLPAGKDLFDSSEVVVGKTGPSAGRNHLWEAKNQSVRRESSHDRRVKDLPDSKAVGSQRTKKQFLALVMKGMYVARLTRPDVLLPTTYLASRVNSPTPSDWNKLRRVVRYLLATSDQGVRIGCEHLQVECYCDASYGVHEDGYSHTGYVVFMGKTLPCENLDVDSNPISQCTNPSVLSVRSPIQVRSCKQKLAATSSTDAEIIALADAVKDGLHARNLLQDLDIDEEDIPPVIVHQDNKSAIILASQDSNKHRRSKHILTKIAYIKHQYKAGLIQLTYCPTADMIADVLTKPLGGYQYQRLKDKLLGIASSTDPAA